MDLLEDLREIDRVAWRCALGKSRFMADIPVNELFEEARSGILEKIATAYRTGEELNRDDLLIAGRTAITSFWGEPGKHFGQRAKEYWADWLDGRPPRHTPGVRRTWSPTDATFEHLIERMAVQEVLSSMPLDEQKNLLLMAAHGSTQACSAQLGVPTSTMSRWVRTARAHFFELWFDWEPAPSVPHSTPVRQRASHCGRGHEFTPENTGKRADKQTGRTARAYRYCITCNREKRDRARLKNQSTPKEGDQSS